METEPNSNIDKKETKLDFKESKYATGRRKKSVARVWLKKGDGKISINGKSIENYFSRPVLQMIVNQPLEVIKGIGDYEIKATVKGGGLSGQAGAIRHGISKALRSYISHSISIPGFGSMESLNVAVAGGILLHSLTASTRLLQTEKK